MFLKITNETLLCWHQWYNFMAPYFVFMHSKSFIYDVLFTCELLNSLSHSVQNVMQHLPAKIPDNSQ